MVLFCARFEPPDLLARHKLASQVKSQVQAINDATMQRLAQFLLRIAMSLKLFYSKMQEFVEFTSDFGEPIRL